MRIFKLVLEEEVGGVLHRIEHIIDVPYILKHYPTKERGNLLFLSLENLDHQLTKQISSGQSSDDAENKQT